MPSTNLKPKTDTVERRVVTCQNIELRAAHEGDDPTPAVMIGYAAFFDQLSDDLGGFRERIAPGAFAKSIGGDVRALFNHDANMILGRTRAKTLRVEEDQRGLRVEITLPDTSAARDLAETVRVGNVDQMSFGFRTKADSWDEVDGDLVRTLIEVELLDVSPVTFPAYPQTEIALRSMSAWQKDQRPDAPPDYSTELRALDLLAQ